MPAALAPAYAIAILMAGGADDGCPSPRQLGDALAAHLPGMVLPLGHVTGPTTLRLSVTTDAAGAMRLDLNDPEGGPLLHRLLPASERSRDCPALAETAALIVERYWHEVGYDVPIETPASPPRAPPPPKSAPPPAAKPPPPTPTAPRAPEEAKKQPPAPKPPPAPSEPLPPPRWWLGAGVTGELDNANQYHGAALLAFGLERPVHRHPIGLRLSAGIGTSALADWSTGQATLRQLPVRLGGYFPIALGVGQLEPGIGVDLDVISVAFTHGSASNSQLHVSPGADIAIGWALTMPHDIYLRALAQAGTQEPYRVVTKLNDTAIFVVPRLDLAFGLELGVWFP